LVDGINGVGLQGIVGGIDDELRDVALSTSKVRPYPNEKLTRDGKRTWGCLAQAEGRRGDTTKERVITGLSPPGGLVLAQLHFGSWHVEGSQEYPAASELLVGPSTLPSWARERTGRRNARMARDRIVGKGAE